MCLAIPGRIVDISMATLALTKQLYVTSPLAYSVTLTRPKFRSRQRPVGGGGQRPALPSDQGRRARPPASDSTAGFLRIEQHVESLTHDKA